jgi:hypothetical protein
MRVISSFQDYYDRSGFVDRTVCYVRENKDEFIDLGNGIETPSRAGIVGFCGKFYPFMRKDEDPNFYYSLEDYLEGNNYYRWHKERVSNFFNYWDKISDDIFIQLDVPILVVKSFNARWGTIRSRALVELNPRLKGYQFQKIKGGQEAFQEIQMYLTNQLVKTKDPDIIEDKYRITQHGFDKHSFRHPVKLKDLK